MAQIKGLFLAIIAAVSIFTAPVQTSPPPVIPMNGERDYTIPELIDYYSDSYGVDKDLSRAIAYCESQYDPIAKNASSTAEGVFQFIDSTFAKYCTGEKLNSKDNISCGVRLISERQTGHWNESVACWYPAYKKRITGT